MALDPQAIADDSWWRVPAPAPLERFHGGILAGGLAAGAGVAWVAADLAVAVGVLWIGGLALPLLTSRAAAVATAELKRAYGALVAGRVGESAASFESLARRRAAPRRARAAALMALAACISHWGLHRRSIVLARHVAGMSGLPRAWNAASWASVQTYAACLGNLEEARDARARAFALDPRSVLYGDMLVAAREERWGDVLRGADALERDAAKHTSVSDWIAIFRAYAMHRCEMDHEDVDEVLATISERPEPHARAIPAWPELREFVERHVDPRTSGTRSSA